MKLSNVLQTMNPYYHNLAIDFDPNILVKRFYELKTQGETTFDSYYEHTNTENIKDLAIDFNVDKIYPNKISMNGFGLSKLIHNIGYHKNPGNNGVIFFVAEGSLLIDFFSYEPPASNMDRIGRPNGLLPEDVTNEMEQEILLTSTTSVTINAGQSVIMNGRKVHSIKMLDEEPIFFGIKIPHYIEFTEVISIFG